MRPSRKLISPRWRATIVTKNGHTFTHEVYGEGKESIAAYVRECYPNGVKSIDVVELDYFGQEIKR